MATNISKYVQLNDFLLLEYEFSRDGVMTNMSSMGATVYTNDFGTKQFVNNVKSAALGVTNNILELNSMPMDVLRNSWFNNSVDVSNFAPYFDASASINITDSQYLYDTVKIHMVSGYNFDDIAGFLLQIRAETSTGELADLSNFSYLKQADTFGGDVVKFSPNTLYLGNRFYDKYVILKVPSVAALAGSTTTSLEQALQIKSLSDVHITYSTVPNISTDSNDNVTYSLAEAINIQLPTTSQADNFNVFIAESTAGDFIEYYATWNDEIIGSYMGDIESGRIKLYTSNNPNDNYQEFSDTYGAQAAKWVLMHELYVYEQLPGITPGSSLLTQKFAFTQEDNFSAPNYFRPVLKNADLDASYMIQYVCRLSNRMDGTQIIRRASFTSNDPKKYGMWFTRLNVENLIPYKIFNRIQDEKANVVEGGNLNKTKYVKVFYDTTTIVSNQNNDVYPDGTGPLFLKNGDAAYKFKFEKLNSASTERMNVDLSGAYNYALLFTLDDGSKIEKVPTYSSNMNTTLGELEFKISGDDSFKLLKQTNNKYSIIVKNPDNTSYVLYEGSYFDNADYTEVMSRVAGINTVGELNKKIADLETKIKLLEDENSKLKTK